jgi:hypothetical protein
MRARPDGERQGLRPASCREIGSSGELRHVTSWLSARVFYQAFFSFFPPDFDFEFLMPRDSRSASPRAGHRPDGKFLVDFMENDSTIFESRKLHPCNSKTSKQKIK